MPLFQKDLLLHHYLGTCSKSSSVTCSIMSHDSCNFDQMIIENLTWFWTVKALRIFSYGILILSRGLISDDIKRIEKVVPGMLTGNRFGGFATPLGAVIFFQELLLYLTMYQKPPSRLPDLWPVIISALSCGVFILFYIRMVFSSRDSWTVHGRTECLMQNP